MLTKATFSRAYANIAFRSTMSSSLETVTLFSMLKSWILSLDCHFEWDVWLLDIGDAVGWDLSKEGEECCCVAWRLDPLISVKMSFGFLLSKILNPENIFLHPSVTSSLPKMLSKSKLFDCFILNSFWI